MKKNYFFKSILTVLGLLFATSSLTAQNRYPVSLTENGNISICTTAFAIPGIVRCDGSPTLNSVRNGNLVIVTSPQPCATYTPPANIVGYDSVCVRVCPFGPCIDITLVATIRPQTSVLVVNTTVGQAPTLLTFPVSSGFNPNMSSACTPTNNRITNFVTSSNTTATYTPGNTPGLDTACFVMYDATLRMYDTTKIYFNVRPIPDPLNSRRTASVPLTATVTSCIIRGNGAGVAHSALFSNVTFIAGSANGTFTLANDTCIKYTANGTVGRDSALISVCNPILGRCDTLKLVVTVTPAAPINPLNLRQTVTIPVGASTISCMQLPATISRTGLISNTRFIAGSANGIFTLLPNDTCIRYVANGIAGIDSAWLSICSPNRCDTLKFVVTVTPAAPINPPNLRQTTTIPVGASTQSCMRLPATISRTGLISNVRFIAGSANGTFTLLPNDTCIRYVANGTAGIDSAWLSICSPNRCDTLKFVVTVTPVPFINPANLRDTITVQQGSTTKACTILPPAISRTGLASNVTFIAGSANGTFTLLPNDTCIQYVANGTVGIDSAWISVCSPNRCDTLKFVVKVIPVPFINPANLRDTITVQQGSTTKACILLPPTISRIGLMSNATFIAGSANGTFTLLPNDTCIQYVANGTIGVDSAWISVCSPNRCDTLKFVVKVTPVPFINPANLRDTITVLQGSTAQSCFILLSSISRTGLTSNVTFIAGSANGTFTLLPNDTCIQYVANGTIGVDSAWISVCSPNRCDTLKFVVTVTPVLPTNTTTIINVVPNTIDTICFPIQSYHTTSNGITTRVFCNGNTNITTNLVTINSVISQENVICYRVAVAEMVGRDTTCIITCTNGVCDTNTIYINVLPPVKIVNATVTQDSIWTYCPDLPLGFSTSVTNSVCNSSLGANVTWSAGGLCVTYQPNNTGIDAVCYVKCDNVSGICDTTKVIFTVLTTNAPVIGLAKSVLNFTQNADASFDVTYRMIVKNHGGQILENIELVDNLGSTFPSPIQYTVIASSITTTGTLVVNNAYNGNTNQRLLESTNGSILPIGGIDTIDFTVHLVMNGLNGRYDNTAFASATGLNSTRITRDNSNNGTNSDPNGNNNPNEANEDVPTPINIPVISPIIGIAKQVIGTPQVVSDDEYVVNYRMIVGNYGVVNLDSIQVFDNLLAAFPTPVTIVAVSATTTGTLVLNPAYNGVSVSGVLLQGNSTLAVNRKDTINVSVRVRIPLDTVCKQYSNTAFAVATGPNNIGSTSDNSDNGNNPDANGNNNPNDADENDPTLIIICPNKPIIGLSKSVEVSPLIGGDGSQYSVSYTIIVSNLGKIDITNAQVIDELVNVFPTPSAFTVSSSSLQATGGLVVNPNYTGIGINTKLLTSSNTLVVNAVDTITFVVTLTTNDFYGPYSNSAIAIGNGTNGFGLTVDTSNAGNVADVNVNGNPNEKTENNPTVFTLQPNKPVFPVFIPEGFSPDGDGINDKFVIENTGSKKVSIWIYNRWGNVVHESADYKNDWNGVATKGILFGTQLPDGTYYYVVSLNDGSKDYVRYFTIKR